MLLPIVSKSAGGIPAASQLPRAQWRKGLLRSNENYIHNPKFVCISGGPIADRSSAFGPHYAARRLDHPRLFSANLLEWLPPLALHSIDERRIQRRLRRHADRHNSRTTGPHVDRTTTTKVMADIRLVKLTTEFQLGLRRLMIRTSFFCSLELMISRPTMTSLTRRIGCKL